MYKAIHRQTQEEIIILSYEWENRLDQLRLMDKSDLLVCQGCEQTVRVRSGELRRRHFAHKHLLGCSYGTESPEILAARAVLYRWLLAKFTRGVTIEKKVDDPDLPHPVDCWVNWKEKIFAYWIIDAGLKSHIRENIRSVFLKLGVSVNWVFVSDMLRQDPNHDGGILLSPTEREFLQKSEYDNITWGDQYFHNQYGGTLHYLDSHNESLITYRSLVLSHSPNVFMGRKEVHPLAEIKFLPKTGEFVHPDEYEQLQKQKSETHQYEQRLKDSKLLPFNHFSNVFDPHKILDPNSSGKLVSNQISGELEKAICIFCNKLTSNWWHIWSEGAIRKCKCRDCYEKGLYSD